MKKILIDASSAILLYKSGLFDILTRTFCTRMTASVYEEVTHDGYPGAMAFKNLLNADRFTVTPSASGKPLCRDHLPAMNALDRGERDTIGEYIHRGGADFIIIDDGKGAGYCRDNDIPYINALLFPKILFMSRELTEPECVSKMEEIMKIGRYSATVIAFAGHCTKSDLDFFRP
ncbi:MAG: hypothetical protein PHP23_12225 [Desulfobacterales bacterium]|nr:hypothetical protein [Desulfobacterales bacterium]MDD4071932.1 hypothetical protein [Desulfobacterales bacterium]MDD4393768.1 hypothetical protein [Desulfobacterales bacterium]